ncbi:MAG: SRPBCC family protein [Acidobacteriota bacterium]
MLKKIGIAVGVLLLGVVGFAMTKPDSFHVERSITVQAPPEKIYPHINDFHTWGEWSPWEKMDPAMTKTYSGAPSGKGAIYEWQSKEVGTGRMEILDSNPTTGVMIKLDFVAPFEAHNVADFTFVPEGGATKVVWAMNGPNNFVSKVMQVFMSMDSMVGNDFEKGLASLKTVAEK